MVPFNLKIRVGDLIAFVRMQHVESNVKVTIVEVQDDESLRLQISPFNISILPELSRRIEACIHAWQRNALRGMSRIESTELRPYYSYRKMPEDLHNQLQPIENRT